MAIRPRQRRLAEATGLTADRPRRSLPPMNTPLVPMDRAASNPPQLAAKTIKDPRGLPGVIEGLASPKAPTRFGCAKALRYVSEQRPDLLYPQFAFFTEMLDHPNQVFKWEAAMLLARLASVDDEDRFAAIFEKYFAPIPGPVMITAGTVIKGGAHIARATPV